MKHVARYCLSLVWAQIILYTNGYRDSNGVNSNVTSGSLQLTQTLFDMSKWRALTPQEKRPVFRMSPIRPISKR